MKCPSCAYDNAEDALSCNLCQFVLRKEKPAAPPAGAPVEPGRIASAKDVADLFLLALQAGTANRFDEAERLMTRVITELSPAEAAELMRASAQRWAQASARPAPEVAIALEAAKMVAEFIITRNFEGAGAVAASMAPSAAETNPDAFRFQLVLLGVRGASRGAEQAAGAPAKLDSPQAVERVFMLAQEALLAGKPDDAARLAARILLELTPNSAGELLTAFGHAWLQACPLTPAEKIDARQAFDMAGTVHAMISARPTPRSNAAAPVRTRASRAWARVWPP